MLSFKHEVFLEVARLKSFTKAGQTLFISQPAVSKSIRQLEAEYKASLFERNGNTIALTVPGQMLFESLQKAKAIEKQLNYDISTYADEYKAKGELRLGASTTVALYIIPPVLSAFHFKHLGVSISLFNRNSESVLQALLDNQIDVGIMEGRNKIASVKSQPFLTDDVVAVCSARSPYAKGARLSIKELKNLPVALRERGSGTLAALRSALQQHQMKLSDLHVSVRLGGTEALKNFIVADICIGFLPMRSVARELETGDLVRVYIDGLSISRQFYFIQRHGEGETDGLSNAFVRYAKAHFNLK
jgi:DNA-binding transcriptional LysR family regulator